MLSRLRSVLAWTLSATLALALVGEAVAQSRNSFRPLFQPGGVSASTNKLAVGATTATGQVPAGASASCKRNGSVTGSASVTAQGAVTCTFGSAIVAGDQFSIPWTLTGESPAATASNGPPPPVTIPANTALPVISGTPQVGQTLASSTGSWSGSPISYAYAWSAGGTQVQAGASNSYTAQSGDVGKTIAVTVTASNTAGSATATSAATSAVAAAAAVVPVASWRVPLSDVTVSGTTNDTVNRTALLASPTNKDLPTFQVASGSTALVTWAAGAIPSPGAILYFTTASGLPNNRTVSASYSFDNFATSTAIPYTPSQTIAGTNNTDDIIDIPAAASGAQIRMSYTASGAQHAVRAQLNQLQSDPAANDIYGGFGMSITITNTQGGQMADQMRAQYPGRDPIYLAVARAGAKPSNYLTEQVPLVQSRPYINRIICDLGVNDRVSGSAQWSNLTTTQQNQIKSDAAAISTWASNNNRKITYVNTTFVDPGTYNGETYTVNQEGVVENGFSTSIVNQDNGTRPYIINAYSPVLSLLDSSWDVAYAVPRWDGYMPSLGNWDLWKGVSNGFAALGDGVHPNNVGAIQYRQGPADAYGYNIGQAKPHYLVRKVAAAEEKGTTTAQKNRLALMWLSLVPTNDNTAQTNRAALQTRINNLSTSYIEASGQTAPTSLPGMVASFDFDDQGRIYSDNAASIPVKDGELAVAVQDKTANGFKLANTAARTTGNYGQPRWLLGEGTGGRSLVYDGTYAVLNSTDAGLVGALDPASQPFIIGWIDQGSQPNLKGSWAFTAGGTTRLSARTQSGGMALQIAGQSAILATEGSAPAAGSTNVYLVTYDGTTLTIRRNGTVTASVAYSKPAWTGDNVRMGGAPSVSSYTGGKRGWHIITGSGNVTAANINALESRLRAQAGT